MRRILTVLVVALIMAAMLVAMAAPAFARHGSPHGGAAQKAKGPPPTSPAYDNFVSSMCRLEAKFSPECP